MVRVSNFLTFAVTVLFREQLSLLRSLTCFSALASSSSPPGPPFGFTLPGKTDIWRFAFALARLVRPEYFEENQLRLILHNKRTSLKQHEFQFNFYQKADKNETH